MLSEIRNFLASIPTVAVQSERLEWIKEKLDEAEKKIANLEMENLELLRENKSLRKEVDAIKEQSAFLDLGICCLKPNPAGGYFQAPYCMDCKKLLSGLSGGYACAECKRLLPKKDVEEALNKAIAKGLIR